MAVSCFEDVFIDLIANWYLGVTILLTAASTAVWILSSTVSTTLSSSHVTRTPRLRCKFGALKAFCFVETFLLSLPEVKSETVWPLLISTLCLLLFVVFPTVMSSPSANIYLKQMSFSCLFFRVESIFALAKGLHSKFKQICSDNNV